MYVKRLFILLFLLLPLSWQQALSATPEIQTWKGAKGSKVFFVESHELPMVDIKILFDAGNARDPLDKKGLAMLSGSLLDEGAGGKDANAISYEFESLGASFSSDVGYDSASLSLRTLSDKNKLKAALKNLKRVVTAPDFPEKSFERQRNRMLVGLTYKKQSPGDLAREAFYAAVYKDHPYAYPKDGTEESLKALTRRDVLDFYNQYYTASNATVAIVGDVSKKRAKAIANDLIRALKKGKAPAPLPKVGPLEAGDQLRIDHPSAQSHILMGQPGMKRGDPDYFILYVGNHILGGSGMVSQLYSEIREKRGLAYSVYSYFSPMREYGPFIAGMQTRADQSEMSLQLLRENIGAYIENGPSAEELDAAKKNITGGFPLRIDSNRDILGYVGVIGFYGLPLDYLDVFNSKIEAVTVAQIKDAFHRRLDLNKMITVTVGPVPVEAESKH